MKNKSQSQNQSQPKEKPPGRKTRSDKWYPDEKDIGYIERMAKVHLPLRKISEILGIDFMTFQRVMEEDERVSSTILKNQALGSSEVYETAHSMAVSGTNPTMTIFWLKCRELWRDTEPDRKEDEPEVTPQNVVRLMEVAKKAQAS